MQIAANGVENAVSDYVVKILSDVSSIEAALKKYIEEHSAQESVESYDSAIKEVKNRQEEITHDIKGLRGHTKDLLLNELN